MKTALEEKVIKQTRQELADIYYEAVREAESGEVSVNDLEEYRKWRMEMAAAALRGEYDRTFTFIQRATYNQTGKCHPFLP